MAEPRAFANVDWWEHRADRPYDEQDGGGLLHPNGTRIVSFDRDFLGAATREVLSIIDAEFSEPDPDYEAMWEQGQRRLRPQRVDS